jgi:hypothetical protein
MIRYLGHYIALISLLFCSSFYLCNNAAFLSHFPGCYINKIPKRQIVFCENIPTKVTQVILLSDWDEVIARDTGTMGKFFSALGTIPFSKSLAIMATSGTTLSKTMRQARKNGQPLKGLASHIDHIIELKPSLRPYRQKLMRALNHAKPDLALIEFYQEMQNKGVPLIIATNNDYESLIIKLHKVNQKLRKRKKGTVTFDACFCAGTLPTNYKSLHDTKAHAVYDGKDCDEYFKQAYQFVLSEYADDPAHTILIFVDDLGKNIARACSVAREMQIPLMAIHHKQRRTKETLMEIERVLMYCCLSPCQNIA